MVSNSRNQIAENWHFQISWPETKKMDKPQSCRRSTGVANQSIMWYRRYGNSKYYRDRISESYVRKSENLTINEQTNITVHNQMNHFVDLSVDRSTKWFHFSLLTVHIDISNRICVINQIERTTYLLISSKLSEAKWNVVPAWWILKALENSTHMKIRESNTAWWLPSHCRYRSLILISAPWNAWNLGSRTIVLIHTLYIKGRIWPSL